MASRKKNRRRKNTRRKNRRNVSYGQEIGLWVALAVSVLLFASNFGFGGAVGGVFSHLLFGLLGLIAYAFPVFLFIGCAFFLSNKDNPVAWVKLVACFAFMLFLCVFLQMLLDSDMTMPPVNAYDYCAKNHTGGGAAGTLIAMALTKCFGKVGTYVISILAMIVCLVLVTERSLFKGLQSGGKKAYQTAKDSHARQAARKEERRRAQKIMEEEDYDDVPVKKSRERRAAQRLPEEVDDGVTSGRRIDKRVSGIMMDTKLEGAKPEKSDALSELSAENVPKREIVEPLKEEEFPFIDTNIVKSSMAEPEIEQEAPAPLPYSIHGLGSAEQTEASELAANELAANRLKAQELKAKEEQTKEEKKREEAVTEETPGEQKTAGSSVPMKVKNPKSGKEQIAEGIDTTKKEMEAAAEQVRGNGEYRFPPISLLSAGSSRVSGDSRMHVHETAQKLQQTLKTFGVNVTITDVSCGPSVTRYELQPEMGVKVSKIVGLSDDIKLNLAAADIRIEAPIPGKAAIGIEVPNKETVTVAFRDLIESDEFQNHKSKIAFGAGKDIAGNVVVADIAKMPHLLIAGATGSGKSVCINTIIMSILYHAKPDEVKLIMIDPKVVELSVYNGIPHLFIPVVTDPKKAAGALHWAVSEMTDRYQKFAEWNVRDLAGYNKKIQQMEGDEKPQKLPQIVIIVDELADLMMVAPGDVEDAICRLAQLARACGIHLILATQRPSVNVITGLIKANMPSRIAFAVSSGVDSRTIIDMNGAEKLLGKGDMLFFPQGIPKPQRVQGAFVSDQEVADVVDFLKETVMEHTYSPEIAEKVDAMSSGNVAGPGEASNERDTYFADAGRLLIEKEKGSIGMIQRMFKVGFNRAARIMDQLQEAGVVGPEEGTKPRKILMSMEEFDEIL